MSGPRRVFLPEFPADGPVLLVGEEAHHLGRVLRAVVGETVELFDGNGRVTTAQVTEISKRSLTLQPQRTQTYTAPPVLGLAVAPPKGDRFDWLIEKAVEWGVTEFIPLITERGVVDPRDSKLERLRQTVIEAAKQSRQPWLMRITAPRPLTALWQEATRPTPLLFGDIDGSPAAATISGIQDWRSPMALIGPEGGWTESERLMMLQAGARGVRLGDSILRTETAAIGFATAIQLGRR